MKKFIFYLSIVLFILFQQSISISQYRKGIINPDNKLFYGKERIKNNKNFMSPGSIKSGTETINGFDNFRLGTDFAETMIATNPNDPLNSICSFSASVLYYTLDGVNWKVPSYLTFNSVDNFVCYDGLGNAYFIEWNYNYAQLLLKSTNKGINWITYQITPNGGDKPSIIAVQTGGPFANYIYSTWQGVVQPRIIYFSKSINGGVNWSVPTRVNNDTDVWLSWITVGPNGSIPGGNLYCGYNAVPLTVNDSFGVYVRRSTDGGNTFLSEIMAAKFLLPGDFCEGYYGLIKNCTVQTNENIQMSADNSNGTNQGNVYIVFGGRGSYPDVSDIYFCRSTDYGSTWSAPHKVNDDNTNTDQWMPSMAVDNTTGKIFLSWYDSRIDPVNNIQCKLYGTVSSDGGLTFSTNTAVSTQSFNPVNIVQNFGWTGYMGHYNGISAIGNTAYYSWVDGRANNMGSYTGYYPDFALTADKEMIYIGANDSAFITMKVPSVNGPFNDKIKFTAVLDTLPQAGNIYLSFTGKDSINNVPDSVILKVKTVGVTNPRVHRIIVTAQGTYNGVPVHKRITNMVTNGNLLNISTNLPGPSFKVNGITYNSPQQLPFLNGANITVQAISPYNRTASSRYVFLNWSDAGDTTHSFIINNNTNLTANYKTQLRFRLISSVGNTYGGTGFYDSLQPHTFGVLSRNVVYNGQSYQFKGWSGTGTGSYSSPDTTGIDSAATVIMNYDIVEVPIWWMVNGIINISNTIPKEFKLYNNFPNPFNPSTKIKFDLPNNSQVKVMIYDLAGREITKLVNEKLQAGTYEVSWNADNLASGVYFYRVEVRHSESSTGDYKDTKRMILIK